MPNQEAQYPNSSAISCILTKTKQKNLPLNWLDFLAQQTIRIDDTGGNNGFYLNFSNLTTQAPLQAHTLLEQMVWALLSHPNCNSVIWPLTTSIAPHHPLSVVRTGTNILQSISQQGFIGLSRTEDSGTLILGPSTTLCFSHALIAEQKSHQLKPTTSLSRRLKNKLTLEQKLFLKRKFDALRELLSFPRQTKVTLTNSLARAKSWAPEFIRPQLALTANATTGNDRIPVLIAAHWLELGGAEKFAIDLIKTLPKDRYALYVTTDIASFNHWSEEIIDQVEAIFHLPSFLTPRMMTIFYEYLIRSRNIRLMHIHHGAKAYESLYHIRRFHPQLQVLDSLHIVELPPNSGGYVEASARHFEAFIDHHHVISHYLKDFLRQRWHVHENKISVIYLNVDSDYFDPDSVEKGRIRRALNIPDNACLVGFIGRFSQQKQPLEFIKTARLLQQRWLTTNQKDQLVFVMTGSGLLESEIKKAINKAAGTKILLHPQVQDARPVYQDYDVLIMPSENEGLALVSYEAMAMQTPIFFTDVGAQSELLDREFLVDNTQPLAEKFADAVWPYLINPEKRRLTGQKMRDYIREHHHHDQTKSQLLALYQQLLKQ